MKIPEYPIKRIEKSPIKKVEQAHDVPIIDVIRHGVARGIQGEPKNHILDTHAPGFRLDEKHLDLKEKGISEIKLSIQELLAKIDKKKEVILIVSSPAWRTHSSALVAEDILRRNGIEILNTQSEIKLFDAIDQMWIHEKRVAKNFYGDDSLETQEQHSDEIQQQARESEALGFRRFLRHMNNIYQWLNPKTLAKLKGKRLRIIIFAHAETTADFIEEAIPGTYQSRGQIMEIIPRSQLKADKKTTTSVKLYPNKEQPKQQISQVVISFKPKK